MVYNHPKLLVAHLDQARICPAKPLGDTSMHAYRAYVIGPDGHIVHRVDLMVEDDEAAKERAKLLVDGRAVELWDRGRKIADFRPLH